MPRPTSPAQADAARLNGAKSHGPTSPAGKAASSKNRLSHGFSSRTVSLVNEDAAAYDQHLAQYMARYTPADQVEADLVALCAVNMWQVMRITAIESALFNLEICGIEDELRRDFSRIDEWARLALAFKKSNGDNCMELLRRYKSTADRAYHRAYEALEKILRDRPSPPPPNDPPVVSTERTPARPIAINSQPSDLSSDGATATVALSTSTAPPVREDRKPPCPA